MVMCDLPYQTTRNHWDTIIPFEPLWELYKRVIKPNGAIVLTASQPFTSALVMSNPKWFKYDLVWEKSIATGFLNANRMPLRGHESVLVFYKKLPLYNPQKFMLSTPSFKTNKNQTRTTENYGKYKENINTGSKDGSRFPRSVFSIKTDAEFFISTSKGNTIHSIQKPVALFEYLIRTYTNEGETVLDNCAGSFTTMEACENLNRQYICIEQEQKYFDLGLQRRQRVREKNRQTSLSYTPALSFTHT